MKSLKRLIRGNTGCNGSINNDNIARALLQHRKTPLRGIDSSPAELALGRQLRDTTPLPRIRYTVSSHWGNYLEERERVMSQNNEAAKLRYDKNARLLKVLVVRDKVLCQDVTTKNWNRSGVIVEVLKYRQYNVKMDGSGRVSIRTRRHLQNISCPQPVVPQRVQIPVDKNMVENENPMNVD